MSSATVKPIPAIVPLPSHGGPTDRRPHPAAGEPRDRQDVAMTATGLPTT